MKTKFVPFKQNILKLALLVSMLMSVVFTQAQELVFHNNFHEPSSSAEGTVGAIYRFPLVTPNMDALVKISGRSSSSVKLENIDISDIGFDKAFQPQISYNNGSTSGNKTWYMEFEVTFVNKNTWAAASIGSFKTTALDVDGDNNHLYEWNSFYYPHNYTVENNSQLTVSNLLQTILGLLTNVGKTFQGTTDDHGGIDTSATRLMTTLQYTGTSAFVMRLGATNTSGSTSKTNRNYSMYFKDFTYNTPLTLPVKLASFSAMLNGNKADLKWVTASEINVSHFVIERSLNGKDFSDAGMVFAYGSESAKTSYSYSDNVNTSQDGVIYYRLRSVDNDGKKQFSDIRVIRISTRSEANLTIVTYPNPVTNELRITLPANWQNKKVVYELFNNNGQVTKKTETASSGQTETMNVSGLSSGFYIVRVSCNGEIAEQKIVKQ